MSEQIQERGLFNEESGGFEDDNIVGSVLEDYLCFVEEVIQSGWHFEANKSVEHGKVEQSFLQHTHVGVNTIFSMFVGLPSTHRLYNEEILRGAVASYCAHDYHKLTDEDSDSRFEITLEETEEFVNEIGVDNIWRNPDLEVLRAVMSSHHMHDDSSKKNTLVLEEEAFDIFYTVLIADSLASTPTIEDAVGKTTQKRVNKLLTDFEIEAHKINENRVVGNTSMLINKAVSETLQDEGWIILRVFQDGVLYLKPTDYDIESAESLVECVTRSFRNNITNYHKDYRVEGVESSNVYTSGRATDYYEVTFLDILMRGFEDTIRGIIHKSVTESKNTSQATVDMRNVIDRIEPIIDVDVHTETRRIEGLAKGIHSIHRYISSNIVKEEGELWETDPLMATLKIFGLYSDIEVREKIQELQSKHDDILKPNQNLLVWYYKYPIAQFVADKYYTGLEQTRLIERLTDDIIMENLNCFNLDSSIEDFFIGDIIDEINAFICRNVSIGKSESDRSNKSLANYASDDSLVVRQLTENDCSICGWGTDADTTGKLIETDSENESVEVSVSPDGSSETVETFDNSVKCYLCQLELVIREANTETWGQDGMVYAKVRSDYGYTPISAWTFEFLHRGQRDYQSETGYKFESFLNSLRNDSLHPSIQQLHSLDKSSKIDKLIYNDDAFDPDVSFGGTVIPVAPIDDKESLYESVCSLSSSAIYAGVGIRFTTNPFTVVDYNNDAIVTFEDSVEREIPLINDSITINNSEGFLRETSALYKTTQYISHNTSNDVFSSMISSIEALSEKTECPVSRLACIAKNQGMNINEYKQEYLNLDSEFSGRNDVRPIADEIHLYLDEIDVENEVGLFESVFDVIVEQDISNPSLLAENQALRNSSGSEYEKRLAERFGNAVEDLVYLSEREENTIVSIREQVTERLEVLTL